MSPIEAQQLTVKAPFFTPRCAGATIEAVQSAERFAALLDMFKGGHASEITVIVDGLADRADDSKDWNTAAYASLPVRALCTASVYR
jgi:hypothetical protein